MNLKNILLIALCLLTQRGFAQSIPQEIRLLDIDEALPIDGASFTYGDLQGVSDTNGVISFLYTEGYSIVISHVSYGSWTLDHDELKKLIQNGVYYRKKLAVNLFPVTIIAVRPQNKIKGGQLKIDYQERLEHDGGAILNQVPAFNSIRKGGNYGFDPVFRGFKYDQLNVVLNGAQSTTVACPNRMDPPTSQMAPNMMDRIEILKGPHALRYGTGFGATINFIPAKLRFSNSTVFYGRISTGYESNGNIDRGESQLGVSGASYDLSLFGSWSQGDDYKTGKDKTVQSDFMRGSFGANLGLKLSANQQLRVSALYNRARDADFPALPMDLRNDDTWMLNARHDIQFDDRKLKSWNSTVYGSFVNHMMDNLLKPLVPRMLNAETIANTYNYGGRTEGVWQLGSGKLYSGVDMRVEGAKGTRSREFLMGPNSGKTVKDNAWQKGRINKTGVFGEYHINSTVFDYIFSGRFELNNANINDASNEFIEVYADPQITQLNTSMSIGVLKSFGDGIRSGLWLGRAQRSGGLTERFINYFPVGQDPYEMIGNPQLDPEVNNQLDLTFEWTKESMAINVDVYSAYLQDYISSVIDPTLSPRLPMSPGVRRFFNISEAFKTGFEVSWSQELISSLQHQLGIAYTYAQDLKRNEALPEIAPLDLRYALSGNYINGKLRPEIVFRYVMDQSRISNEFGETTTPSFTLLDIKIDYSITDKLTVSAEINNLLDAEYYEHLSRSVRSSNNPIFAPGRNILAKINYSF